MAGSISTHVLDTDLGRPRSGVRVTLSYGDELVASGETDADGRIRDLATGLAVGIYRLAFEVPSPFFGRVVLEIHVSDGHQHVPLVFSRYAISSYRGS